MTNDGPLRLMFDTNVIDCLLEDGNVISQLAEAVAANRCRPIAAHVQADQLAKAPDTKRAERMKLLNLFWWLDAEPVPTSQIELGISRLGRAVLGQPEPYQTFRGSPPDPKDRHATDALIALTAMNEGATLVTEDIGLRARVEQLVPDASIWSLADLTAWLAT